MKTITRRGFCVAFSASLFGTSDCASASDQARLGDFLISGFRGTKPGDPEVDEIRQMLSLGMLAGVILLERNIQSRAQLARLSDYLTEACPGPAPIICIDQEGGRVVRTGRAKDFSRWLSAKEIATLGMSDSDLNDYYLQRASELVEAGINLNLGPVVDLAINPKNPIIAKLGRSYGKTSEAVTRHASAFVRAHRTAGIRTCLKHYPGHGSSATDSHIAVTDIGKTWANEELVPFRDMTASDLVDMVMTGHLIQELVSDGPGIPATLSRQSVRRIRDDMRFHGPVITDDMQMKAITTHFSDEDAALAALRAGHSFLIYSNYYKHQTPSQVRRLYDRVAPNRLMQSEALVAQAKTGLAFRSALNI